MTFLLAPATVEILQAAASAIGIALGLIVVAIALGEIGSMFIATEM